MVNNTRNALYGLLRGGFKKLYCLHIINYIRNTKIFDSMKKKKKKN